MMQARAILRRFAVTPKQVTPSPEIMVPLAATAREILCKQEKDAAATAVMDEAGVYIYLVGTMVGAASVHLCRGAG